MARKRGIVINPVQQSLAAGYWGPAGAKALMLSTQVVERITKSNTDWVRMGVITDLWVPPQHNLDQLPVCSCIKVTNQSADIRCLKCNGLKLIPGYVKWGYDTYFYSAVNLGFTGQTDVGFGMPEGIVKNVSTTLHTLQLAPGVLSASFQTPDFAVNNVYLQFWELQTLIYNRAPGNSYHVQWSLDRGNTWISGDFDALQLARGTLRFQVTLSRTSANSPSPQFEILRFRHPIIDEPFIRLAKNMGSRKKSREEWGKVENESGIKYVLLPLIGETRVNGQVVFDQGWLPLEHPPIFLLREGTFAGTRYAQISTERSEHIGVMTLQSIAVRAVQPDEIYGALF